MPLSLAQSAFSGGEWSPSAYGRQDIDKALIACKTLLNMFVHPEGGSSNRAGTEFVIPTKTILTTRAIPFSYNDTDTYVIEMGPGYMRWVRNGAQVLWPDAGITAITKANPAQVTVPGSNVPTGAQVYIVGGDMVEIEGGPYTVTAVDANNFTLNGVDSTGFTTYTGGAVSQRIAEIATPYAEADLFDIRFSQSNNVMTLTHQGYQARELRRADHHLWTLSPIVFAPEIAAPTAVTVTPLTAGSTTYKYAVTAVKDETFEESLAGLGQTTAAATLSATNTITISWTAPAGTIAKYNVYRENNGVYGFIGTANGLTFKDIFIDPDYSNTVPVQRDPISTAQNYPRANGLYGQRRIFAASILKPATWWTTQTGNYYNMNTSNPLKASDAITLALTAGRADAIQHVLALDNLILLTTGAVWLIKPDGGVLAADTPPDQKPQERHGSSKVPPLILGSTALFIQSKGQIVRDLGYLFETDKYQGSDINVLARHIVRRKRIVDWAYAEAPYYIVWGILNDGSAFGLTYVPEYKVVAWHRHNTDGQFKSVCAISEGGEEGEDVPYFIVQRQVNGQTVQYIERMHTREFADIKDAFFVDCGLTYEGPAVNRIYGLKHLRGKTVSILADGNVHAPVVVQWSESRKDGYIDLNRSVEKAHIGLGYVSDLAPLDFEVSLPTGSSTGKKKTVSKLHLYLTDTRGFKAGVNPNKLVEVKPELPANWDEALPTVNGVVTLNLLSQWAKQGSVFIRNENPTPITVNKIVPEVEIGLI